MKIGSLFTFLSALCWLVSSPGVALASSENSDPPAAPAAVTLQEIIDKIENRYTGSDFSARFDQRSTLAAMQISDTAAGKVFFKHPGMMRWEYEKPDPQTIITNGADLWIYRPLDNQVMVGKAPVYFGGGKGASFLSDIKYLRKYFDVSLEAADPEGFQLIGRV